MVSMKALRTALLFLSTMLFIAGCTSPFYKEVDGTSTILGVSLPDEQYIQINALSYLGGSKTIVREPACITHQYVSVSSNTYFGVIHTFETRTNSISIALTNTPENVETKKQ